MAEALACGTPVIPFPEGAGTETVSGGEHSLPVPDKVEIARTVERLASIEPRHCPTSVAEPHDSAVTASGCERPHRCARDRHGVWEAPIAHGSPVSERLCADPRKVR